MVWKPKAVPKSWKKDYGTVRVWKNGKSYIHVNRVSKDDKFRHRMYVEDGIRYEISSNKFGSSHHKKLASASNYAKRLMKAKRRK